MIQTGKAFNPSMHIMRSSIQFIPSITVHHMSHHCPILKDRPLQKRVAITIASTPGACTCAITALKALFEFVGQLPKSPFFMQVDGAPLFMGVLHLTGQSRFDLHRLQSIKIFWPQFPLWCGIFSSSSCFNDYEIQLLGRWHS